MASWPPTIRFGAITVSVTSQGWPHWAHIQHGNHQIGLDSGEVRALSDALVRIVTFLDAKEERRTK